MNDTIWRKIGALAVGTLLLLGCGSESEPNLDSVEVDLDIQRFEQLLFSQDVYQLEEGIAEMRSEHPDFFNLYSYEIIELGDPEAEGYPSRLGKFVNDQMIYQLSQKVQSKYAEITDIENELTQAFKRYLHYFPENELPKIYTYISGFNQSIVTAEGILGIGLDKYLGETEPMYQQLYPPMPQYMCYRMHEKKIVSDLIYGHAVAEFEYAANESHLLNQMVFYGRAMYLVDQLLPDHHDTLIWAFTPEQLKFVESHERRMWTYLIENKLLFKNDQKMVMKYIEDAPFTKDFGRDSPGRAVVWVGYQIVDAFMKRNKDISLKELMEIDDYQSILNKSKYNP